MSIGPILPRTLRISCASVPIAKKLPKPVETELFSWPKEEKPWPRFHMEFAGPLNGKMFLIVVGAYSKWLEVSELSSTTSEATIRQLSELFAQQNLFGLRRLNRRITLNYTDKPKFNDGTYTGCSIPAETPNGTNPSNGRLQRIQPPSRVQIKPTKNTTCR
ncbi:hypothetical protein TELCIR_16881 [Teladorsagia circumcincta]|uniref:Uncharacterized protein n=1 Tax=Teladorsagia circumcincta TaxID=45464 RepID=A0A2G9TWG2_TELCI|nr:hypothetical protein TELCIR_16881 [Teladorsagia circumcincta]